MTISFASVVIKHERVVRLVFSTPLDAGAYNAGLYQVTSLDAAGVSPVVSAALLIPGNPEVVGLVLADALVKGGMYEFSAVGVPALDASVTPAGSVLRVRYSNMLPAENVEPIKRNRERLLYGVDLLWNGSDYQESSSGDLERVGGTANVTKALYRVVESPGLPWDPSWGVGVREFVDSPSLASGTLRGKMMSQMLRDPRVKNVTVTVEFDDEKTFLHANPKLITGEALERVSLMVPSDV